MTTKTSTSAVKTTAVSSPLPTPATAGPSSKPKQEAANREAVQYRYQLVQHLVERRPDGWYFAKTWSMVAGERPMWLGPYDLPQDVCLAIARSQCAELSNRHHAQASFHKVKPGDPLYGLPVSPKMTAPPKRGDRS